MDARSWSTGILGNSIQTTWGFHLTRQKQHETLSVHSNKNPSSWRLIKNQLKFTPWFKTKLCLGAHSNVLFLEDHLYIKNQIVDITTICKRFSCSEVHRAPVLASLLTMKTWRFTPPIPRYLEPGLLESGAMQVHWREEHLTPRLGKRNGAKNEKRHLGFF